MDPQYKPSLLKTTSEIDSRLYKLDFDTQYFMSEFYSLHHNLPLKIGYKCAGGRIYYFFFMSKRQVIQVIGYPVLSSGARLRLGASVRRPPFTAYRSS
jgi:hypothetical protein